MLYLTVLLSTLCGHLFSHNRGPTPRIYMVHYGQTVLAQWLLLADYSHLPYVMSPMYTLHFPPNSDTEPTSHTHLLAYMVSPP